VATVATSGKRLSVQLEAGERLHTYGAMTTLVTGSNANPGQRVYTLPNWSRHGTQPTYWTEAWRRKEILAELDIIAGNVRETSDVEELIRELNETAAHAAEAE